MSGKERGIVFSLEDIFRQTDEQEGKYIGRVVRWGKAFIERNPKRSPLLTKEEVDLIDAELLLGENKITRLDNTIIQ